MSNPYRTAEQLRREHGMPAPAPIPPRDAGVEYSTPECIDYAHARRQIEQAQACCLGIQDFVKDALDTARITQTPIHINAATRLILSVLNEYAATLRDLDLHQPFQE